MHQRSYKALESRIASAAHDVIESHVVDQIRAGTTLAGKATSCFLPDLQKAIDDIGFVKGKAMQVKPKRKLTAEEPTYSPPPASSEPPTSEKNVMVGVEAVAFRLMDMFIGGSQRVIPIVGMGGIGKTTLAKHVYDHSLIHHHFDVRLWATITQEISVENILTELLLGERKSATGGNVSELGEELHKNFPKFEFQQVNLRYLESAYLPSSLSLLWNMQTLDGIMISITLPYEIWEVSQLRHLSSFRLRLPDPLPGDRSNQQECVVLRNLQTLARVENLRLTEEVCKRMPNIKHLSLHYDGDCKGSSYYCLHNLGRLNKLESLQCFFAFDSKWRNVFLSFILPSSLEELTLMNCEWEDLTKVMKSLPHLGYLQLYNVEGSEWDLAEEKFISLKILSICGCDGLRNWNAGSSHFPALENLSIVNASQLCEIPCDIGEIPTLNRIELDDCSVSAAISAMRIVVEQESLGNQDLLLDVDFDNEMEKVERLREMVQEECLTSKSICLRNGGKEIKLRPSQL